MNRACWPSIAAAAEAERLGREQAEDEALEQRQAEIKADALTAMTAAMDCRIGAVAELIQAIDSAMEAGNCPGAAEIVLALQGDASALRRWAAGCVQQAAEDRAAAYTLARLRADAASEAAFAAELA